MNASTTEPGPLKVRGLFGRFDYDLPITRVDSPIAILTAPNGYGKTHLLHMIDAVARQDYQELSRYTFDSLEIQLADQSQMTVTRMNTEGSSGICRMELQEQSLNTEQKQTGQRGGTSSMGGTLGECRG